MIPLRKLIAVVAVFAVMATACSSQSPTVATITYPDAETVLTEADLASMYASDTVPVGEQLRATIFALVARDILFYGMDADLGISLDEQQVAQLFDEIVAEMEAQGVEPALFLGIPDAGIEMVRFDAQLAVMRTQVITELAARSELADQLFENPVGITTVCASHILVESEGEAEEVIDRLEDGEDFSEVADELSLDSAAEGGDLGCRLASDYVGNFATAALEADLGEFFGPVETEFGWHVLTVVDRTAPTRAEFDADPASFLSSQDTTALWQEWFNGQIRDADVTIEERYGTWSPAGIVPPTE